MHDVTELTESRMQLAAAQRDNVALLQTLNQHAIVSVADRTGRIIEVNDAFCHISGFQRQELLGQNHRIVNSGEHDRAFWVSMWRTISSGQSWREEVCNRAKDGTLYWVDSVVAPFMDAHGRVEKYVSIRTDITNRKRTELELQRTLALLRAVLEASTQVAIVATDPRGVVSLLNRGAELCWTRTPTKWSGKRMRWPSLKPMSLRKMPSPWATKWMAQASLERCAVWPSSTRPRRTRRRSGSCGGPMVCGCPCRWR